MSVKAKIENPICIKFGANENIIMADDFCKENSPLTPGARFGGNHYGFVLIVDHNGIQREMVYPTQCRITAACTSDGVLNIFESGKKKPWTFDKTGKLVLSIFDENLEPNPSDEIYTIATNADLLMGSPTLMHPIYIRLSSDPSESIIQRDERINKDYPISPGLILGTEHYGFVLVIETEKGEKEIVYPTQNRLHGVSCNSSYGDYVDLNIYEEGKYNPWIFTTAGEFKSAASYNEYSKSDLEYIKKNIASDMPINEDRYILNLKK